MRSFWRVGVRTVAAVLIAGLVQRASAQGFDKWGDAGRERINQGTIGLAAGLPEGAPLRLAAEIARALNQGDNLRILPIVTRGVFDNFVDLLQLRGVDAAIVYGPRPYTLVVLVRGIQDGKRAQALIAEISKAIWTGLSQQ